MKIKIVWSSIIFLVTGAVFFESKLMVLGCTFSTLGILGLLFLPLLADQLNNDK
jgi:hypothetical protein